MTSNLHSLNHCAILAVPLGKKLLNFGISPILLGRVSLHFLSQNSLFDLYLLLGKFFQLYNWGGVLPQLGLGIFSAKGRERLNKIQHVACDYNKELKIWRVSYEIIWTDPDVIWLKSLSKTAGFVFSWVNFLQQWKVGHI